MRHWWRCGRGQQKIFFSILVMAAASEEDENISSIHGVGFVWYFCKRGGGFNNSFCGERFCAGAGDFCGRIGGVDKNYFVIG